MISLLYIYIYIYIYIYNKDTITRVIQHVRFK